MSLEYVLKSVNVFAFTNKLKLVMKGNELELWITFFNNMQLYHSTVVTIEMLIVNKHYTIFTTLY